MGMNCRMVVGEITSYLEGAIEPHQRTEIDLHLAKCAGCSAALAQFERTIEVTGTLTVDEVEALPPDVIDDLVATFAASR
jgi:anti-sigma factor RsiW